MIVIDVSSLADIADSTMLSSPKTSLHRFKIVTRSISQKLCSRECRVLVSRPTWPCRQT